MLLELQGFGVVDAADAEQAKESHGLLASDLGNRKPAADFAREEIDDLIVPRYGFDLTGPRIYPQRMSSVFSLEAATMQTEMA